MQNNSDSKGNLFVRILKGAGNGLKTFFQNMWYDFVNSFKYNNMKLGAILFALPGVLIGMFIGFHYNLINQLTNEYNQYEAPVLVQCTSTSDNNVEFTIPDILMEITIDYASKNKNTISFTKVENGKDPVNKYVGNYVGTIVEEQSVNTNREVKDIKLELSNQGEGENKVATLSYTYVTKQGSNGEADQTNSNTTLMRYVIKGDNEVSFSVCSEEGKKLFPFDFAAVALFFLMLVSILNIFLALNLSGKKNLGNVVIATISTVIILTLSVLYFVRVFTTVNAISAGLINNKWEWTADGVWALLSILISDVLTVAGLVWAWIFYDRTYEKVDR